MSRYRKLGKNFGLLTIGSFASSLLSFFLVPLYTAVLSTEEYGVSDIISVTISLLFPIMTLVISESIMRFSLDPQNEKEQIFSVGFYITSAGCLAMLLLSPVIFYTSISEYYLFFVAYFIVQSFYTMLAQFTKGQDKVREYALGGVLNTIIVIGSNIVLLLVVKWGVRGYLFSLIFGHLVTSLYYIIVNKIWRYFVPLFSVDRKIAKQMLAYSCPMILNSVSWWISNSSDKYILSYYRGLSENGIYAVAYKIPSLLSVITGLFISAWQISAVENFNSIESRKFYSDVCEKYIGLNAIVSGGLIALSRILARILFSHNFYTAWRITPILIIAFVFNTLSSFYGTIYTSAKQTKMLMYSTLFAAFVNIVLNIILIPPMGGTGAAIATLISYCLIWAIRVVDSRKIMKIEIKWNIVLIDLAILVSQTIILNYDSIWTDLVCMFLVGVLCAVNFNTFKSIIIIAAEKMHLGGKL